MKIFVTLIALAGIIAISFNLGTSWPAFDAGYQRCIARGGEHYQNKVCYRTKIETIDIDGHDQ